MSRPRSPRPLPLTATQRAVWARIAAGREGKEIARDLGLGYATVKTHTRNLFSRIGVHNRVEATRRYYGIAA